MVVLARVDRQPAFVLHRRAYREGSLLLDVLTRDFGRIALVARAARASKKGQGSLLQPFQALLVSWSGKGELKTLVSVERSQMLPLVTGERLYSALYLNELLVRSLAPADPHLPVFEAYESLLPGLAEDPDHEPLLRNFELKLLLKQTKVNLWPLQEHPEPMTSPHQGVEILLRNIVHDKASHLCLRYLFFLRMWRVL